MLAYDHHLFTYDFNAGKLQLRSFERTINSGAIDVKINGPILTEKPFLKMLGLPFSTKLYWGSYIVFIAEAASKKSEALIYSTN